MPVLDHEKESIMLTTTQTQSSITEILPAPQPAGRERMSAAEEARLARAWQQRADRSARDQLVTANLGLVVSIARRYRNAGVPLEELIAEGNVGLLSAVDGFDPESGFRLSTYAAYWIRQGIGRAFAASTPRGRLVARDRRDLTAMEHAARAFYARTGTAPTDAELARELGWSAERVRECRGMHVSHSRPCSLDQPRPDGETASIQPAAPAAEAPLAPGGAAAQVDSLLRDLTPFERSAVELRFGLHGTEPRSLDGVACSLGHTRRETRAVLRAAMAKLARRGRSGSQLGEEAPGMARMVAPGEHAKSTSAE